MSMENEIESIEEEIRKTPYHKATQAHIGRLKARLAKLRAGEESASKGGSYEGFGVKKSGDATVLLVGFPSVGKSTLVNNITNAKSKIGEYDFTTLEVIPGMLEYNGANIQILDIPGLIVDASTGKGKGRQVLSMVRNADLIIIVIDKANQLGPIKNELYSAGFRLDKKRPDVRIIKKDTGGLHINLAGKRTKIDKETVKNVLSEFKVHNADVIIRQKINVEELIDSIMTNRVYVPSIVVFNKVDKLKGAELEKTNKNILRISALKKTNIEPMVELIWKKLELMRVYMKHPGKEPDMAEPLILKEGSTIADSSRKTLRTRARYLKYARIWGPSSRFPSQKVGPDHKLKDQDIVELHA